MITEEWSIGVDLGGTKVKAARVNAAGQILEEQAFATEALRRPNEIIDDIVSAIRKLDPESQCSVGIGVAGQVEAHTGVVHFAPNLKWWDVPLQSTLNEALHTPITVINDVRAATWGEWFHGAGRNCQDLVCLFIGTGIGGGIISGGKLLLGHNNTAGELGHMVIDPNGPRCGCGNKGCLEAWASGANLAAQARTLIAQSPDLGRALLNLAEGDPEKITAQMISLAYADGDPLAEKLVETAIQALILGSTNIVNSLNPQKLILGGGVIKSLPHLIQKVDQGVRRLALSSATERLEVCAAELKNDAGVIGAAAYALAMMPKATRE